MPTEPEIHAEVSSSSTDKLADFLSTVIGVVFVLAIIGSAFEPVRRFFTSYWKFIVPAVVVGGAAVWSWVPLRTRMRRSVTTKVGAIVASLAVLSMVVGLVGILPDPRYQILALRSILVLTACLFPSVLYYLFIATRKDSLFSEFFTNLERLGLLVRGRAHSAAEPGSAEPEAAEGFRLRLLTYVQKFEAAYGPLDSDLVDNILTKNESDPRGAFFNEKGQRRPSAAIFSPEAAAPLVICTTLVALGWIIALPPWRVQPSLPVAAAGAASSADTTWAWALYPDASPVYYAFIGAYFFGIQMLFRRYVLKDLRIGAYVSLSLRILLALIGVWVLVPAAIALGMNVDSGDTRMLVVAFAIGFFPPVIWQFIQAVFKTITFAAFFLPSLESEMPLSQLDGLTIWHEARLQEEDIENVPNMATASLVDLMLNTRFSPDRIVDWVDQAILYTHLGPEAEDAKAAEQRRSRLRAHGIRGASALVATYQWSANGSREAFEKILPSEELSTVRTQVQTVVTNPNLQMILAWRQLRPLATEAGESTGKKEMGIFESLDALPAGTAPPR